MERAALHKLYACEDVPSAKNWETIAEQLDREQLRTRLQTEESQPPASSWAAIQASQKNRSITSSRLIQLSLLLASALGITFWVLRPSSLPEQTARHELRHPIQPQSYDTLLPSPVLPTQTPIKIQPESARVDPTHSSRFNQATPPALRTDYLWVASKGGEPIRVPVKWEALACCLSGESQSRECDQQQDKWHAEVLQTELGFQADPFLGLMALIDSRN